MQLIRLFLNIPLSLIAVDLQIVTSWESQTHCSVLLSGWEGSFPLTGLGLHLSSVSVSGDSSLGDAACHRTSPCQGAGDAELGFQE